MNKYLLLFLLSTSAQASLVAGNGMVYDTDLNKTFRVNPAGPLFYGDAVDWAASLGSGWSLPFTPTEDLQCSNPNHFTGYQCISSDLGHVWYTELLNVGWATGVPLTNNFGPFEGISTIAEDSVYWSGSVNNLSMVFDFGRTGIQLSYQQPARAMAVHEGNLITPLPSAVWLLLSGLVGLNLLRRKKLTKET